jgi:hypothetical protein
VFVSVTFLYESGQRLSDYRVRIQRPLVGWLVFQTTDHGGMQRKRCVAKLVDEHRQPLAELQYARLLECRGPRGALIEGVVFRYRGRKAAIQDKQAWWCEAPPRLTPLVDHEARLRVANEHFVSEAERLHGERIEKT